LIGRQEGHLACEKLGVGMLVAAFDCSFARLIAPIVTASIVLTSKNPEWRHSGIHLTGL